MIVVVTVNGNGRKIYTMLMYYILFGLTLRKEKVIDILKHNNKLHLLFFCLIGFVCFVVGNIHTQILSVEDNIWYLISCFVCFVPLLFVRKRGANKWLQPGS